MKKIILLLIALVSMTSAIAQIRIGKAILPYEQTFREETLKLNGAGLRQVLWMDMYAGGLYLKTRSKDPLEILDRDESMGIRLNIVSRLITKDRLVKSMREGFEKATFGNTKSLDGRINKMLKILSDPIVKNDVYDVVYIKGKGIVIFKNDKEIGMIEGRDFKYAFFKIYLGENPASEKLKNGMLGIQ